MQIISAEHHLPLVRELIVEYTQWLGVDLCFQGLQDELAHLENKYLPPFGGLLIALDDSGAAAGCCAFHWLDAKRAEMKRLYVRPQYRGQALGSRLARRVMDAAFAEGAEEILLDTLDTLTSALALYRRLGFEEIPPYYGNPLPGVVYFRKRRP